MMKGRKSLWVCGAPGATPEIHYPQKAYGSKCKYEMNNNNHLMSSKNDGCSHLAFACVRESVRIRDMG